MSDRDQRAARRDGRREMLERQLHHASDRRMENNLMNSDGRISSPTRQSEYGHDIHEQSPTSRKGSRRMDLEGSRERRTDILESISNRPYSSLKDHPEDIFSNEKDKTATQRKGISFVRDRLTESPMNTTFLDKYDVENLASASSRDLEEGIRSLDRRLTQFKDMNSKVLTSTGYSDLFISMMHAFRNNAEQCGRYEEINTQKNRPFGGSPQDLNDDFVKNRAVDNAMNKYGGADGQPENSAKSEKHLRINNEYRKSDIVSESNYNGDYGLSANAEYRRHIKYEDGKYKDNERGANIVEGYVSKEHNKYTHKRRTDNHESGIEKKEY